MKELWKEFPKVPEIRKSPSGEKLTFSDIECHLCDSLQTVHSRAKSFWCITKKAYDFTKAAGIAEDSSETQHGGDNGDDILIIDAFVYGFQGYQALRRDHKDVPLVGSHRLLAASSTRLGLGKPVVSKYFPVELWQKLKEPVKHFVLQATEQVGGLTCIPLYPNMPSPEDMTWLVHDVHRQIDEDWELDFECHSDTLKQIGLHSASVQRRERFLNFGSPFESEEIKTVNYDEFIREFVWTEGKCMSDWMLAIDECQSALYDPNIEKSLHLQGILDLHPLHKRILGLIEYMIIPKIQVTGPASRVYSDAFCGNSNSGNRRNKGLTFQDGIRATLETEGNWLIIAGKQTAASVNTLDLAYMIDSLIAEIISAPQVRAIRLTLDPASPSEQARQISLVSNNSRKDAALICLYLGKIALMLRNAIEHGFDQVAGDGLEVDCSGYWSEMRKLPAQQHHQAGPQYVPIFDWDKQCSCNTWRSDHLLQQMNAVPQSARSLILTPESLKRCLVLLSLVLEGCKSHLGLKY